MSRETIYSLKRLFTKHGASYIYFKTLAPSQDNENNQVYLGSELDSIAQIFSATIGARRPAKA